MKHFVNDHSRLVSEAVEAAVRLGEGKLALLDGLPDIKVVVRTDWDKSQVAVVSGGGAGHEPAHVGFVGYGMLTAAVCGEVFASPSVDAVLAAILAVTGPRGCLLIVKNYTGDRLNFGLAAERARALGLDVEMVIVADDIALEGALRPRGLAGTLFVHKAAGHLAGLGAPLAKVKALAERVARSVVSMGLSLGPCTLPGQPTENRMGAHEIELGLGIHGEPGARIEPMASARELARMLTKAIDDALDARSPKSEPIALLINDLGGVPPIELGVMTREILASMRREVALVFGPCRFMTSLDMKGISLSALPLDPRHAEAFESQVAPRDWQRGVRPCKVSVIALPAAMAPKAYVPSTSPHHREALARIGEALIAAEAELNALDAKVGDGDTGTTFATAARAVIANLDALPLGDAPSLCAALGDLLSKVMGGSSGVLLAIFVSAVGSALTSNPDWPSALRLGVLRIQHYGGATEGDRTMLDALVPAVSALESGEGVSGAWAAAEAGAKLTASMAKASAGRSSYVREDALLGVPDPGAVAVARAFEALSRG